MAVEGSQRASLSASNGAVVVEKTVRVMAQIADRVQETAKTVESLGVRSDQIGAIIGTIEDIADQTNLLALNAAIEAAERENKVEALQSLQMKSVHLPREQPELLVKLEK
jgi:methyl-accepting chemotaxis protein